MGSHPNIEAARIGLGVGTSVTGEVVWNCYVMLTFLIKYTNSEVI